MQTRCHLSVLIHEQAKKYGSRTALTFKSFGKDNEVRKIFLAEKIRHHFTTGAGTGRWIVFLYQNGKTGRCAFYY